jgi:hypothetical protein
MPCRDPKLLPVPLPCECPLPGGGEVAGGGVALYPGGFVRPGAVALEPWAWLALL